MSDCNRKSPLCIKITGTSYIYLSSRCDEMRVAEIDEVR